MDHRLFRAACIGDIAELHVLLQEDPFLLGDDSLIRLHENPVTTAIKARQLPFLREIKKLRPALLAQPNQEGFLPLHIASSYGYVEFVKELLSTPSTETSCRVFSGRDGKVPLHYAAINGRVDIIVELLTACSDSVKDVTYFGETALHLAVKYFKFEALKHLLIWLERIGMPELLNLPDKEGNTVLHYAVSRKQVEIVEFLINSSLMGNSTSTVSLVNAVNNKGLTAMDILDILTELSSDMELRKVLQGAGGTCNYHVAASSVSNHNNEEVSPIADRPDGKPEKWMEYFQFQYKRDSPGEARNALLVVAALFATVSFQAGINPPSYIFEHVSSKTAPAILTVFLAANTLALSAAVLIIEILTRGMPFQREIKLSVFSVMFGYGWSVGLIKPIGSLTTIVLVTSSMLPWLFRYIPLLCG